MYAEDAHGFLGHARYRGRALALVFAGAVFSTAVASTIPPRTEAGVAGLLGRGVGGAVDEHDFVWEPSRGWLIDAFVGRRIVFLAKREGQAARELYRGLVTVTPQGRPMALRASAALTETDLADESALLVAGGRAAVRLDGLNGAPTQAIEVVDLEAPGEGARVRSVLRDAVAPLLRLPITSAPRSRRVVFQTPQRDTVFELQGRELVIGFAGGSAALVDAAGSLTFAGDSAIAPFVVDGAQRATEPSLRDLLDRARSFLGLRVDRVGASPEGPNRVAAPAAPAGSPTLRFPPDDRFHPLDAHPGFFSVDAPAGLRVVALDTRRLDFELVPGQRAAESRTGHAASGRLRARRPEAVVRLPVADRAGAWDRDTLIAPLRSDRDTLAETRAGWGFGALPDGIDAPSFAVQWAPEADDEERPRAQLCVTRSGHLALAYGTSTATAANAVIAKLDCAYATPAGSPSSGGVGGAWIDATLRASPWEGASATFDAMADGGADSLLVITRHATDPTVPAPDGEGWSAVSVQPDPASIPAIYEASSQTLGTTVHVRLLLANRFDWAIRAGDEEKQHRFGGTFERALSATDVERVYFAAGLGVAKRQDPLGLKIAGGMGHRFHDGVGLIGVKVGGLDIRPSSASEPSMDATECPITASAGSLTPAARDSGPRQSRADICALPDGSVLVAEGVFDNHEATASTLVNLGCSFVVALDRGAERAAWTRDRSDDDVGVERATSVLFALARPWPGSLQR
ncbi:MAG: hypothetical protein U0414_13100 [Polyangiaceae bacterium]